MAFLGRENEDKVRKVAEYVRRQQRADGSWGHYPGGPIELSGSVKAYFALKLTGRDPDAPYMVQAREAIRAEGGAGLCNSFTKFYLALLGQFPYANCPSVPPELVLLPSWAYVNLYAMSSWTRTIVVPLSIFSATKPVRRLPPELGIRELFLKPPETPMPPGPPPRRLLELGQLLSRRRCGVQDGGTARFARADPQEGCGQGCCLDARALPGQRRPRRHFPANDLHRRRPALPRRGGRRAGDALGGRSSSTT